MTLCNRTRIQRERAYRDACFSALPKQMFPHPPQQASRFSFHRTREPVRGYRLGAFRSQPPYIANTTAVWGGGAVKRLVDWMPRKIRDSIPALVLEVIARVYELAERRTQPWYIHRSALDLGHASESVDSSIYYAEVRGWLVGAGEPPKSVAVTADGVRLLEECGYLRRRAQRFDLGSNPSR
jgi:hypothetical protein